MWFTKIRLNSYCLMASLENGTYAMSLTLTIIGIGYLFYGVIKITKF